MGLVVMIGAKITRIDYPSNLFTEISKIKLEKQANENYSFII